MEHHPIWQLCLCAVVALSTHHSEAEERIVSFQSTEDSVVVIVNEQEVGTYFLRDPVGKIRRPYFAHMKTLGGIQVTRNHPPEPGDRDDHATMHPGIWLGFGDVSGVDFWRNRGRVHHVRFDRPPAADGNRGGFVQRKRYVDESGDIVCDEDFTFSIHADSDRYLLLFDSTFTAARSFGFGDQEEMGWGVRVATPISETAGGLVQDATGRSGAKSIWSHSAAWCNYGGAIDGREVGLAIFCHPANFRDSWFHARDYGLLVANPFGRAAMNKGEVSHVEVQPGASLRLRFGILVHAGYDKDKIDAAYEAYRAATETLVEGVRTQSK